MESLPAELLHETKVLSRPYSPMRTIHAKWIANKQAPLHEVPSKALEVSVEALLARLCLKQHPALFQTLLEFWNLLNPLALRGISKQLYSQVTLVMYAIQMDGEDPFSYMRQDRKVDFSTNASLTFCEFYDSFFEFFDSQTKTQLVSEYVRFAKLLMNKLRGSDALRYFNFAAKKHLEETPRPTHAEWMHWRLKELTALKQIKGMPLLSQRVASLSHVHKRMPPRRLDSASSAKHYAARTPRLLGPTSINLSLSVNQPSDRKPPASGLFGAGQVSRLRHSSRRKRLF